MRLGTMYTEVPANRSGVLASPPFGYRAWVIFQKYNRRQEGDTVMSDTYRQRKVVASFFANKNKAGAMCLVLCHIRE